MAQRIFIKVVGFSDEERHALNTIFRLSEQCSTMYQLWAPDAPQLPKAAFLDGQSWEARVEAEAPSRGDLRLLWVGPHPPPGMWRSFARPLAWPEVIETLDALFLPQAEGGLDRAAAQTPPMSQRQALIVGGSRDDRLYLRARLALAKLPFADEALTGAQALDLVREKQYDLALVDCGSADVLAWQLVRQLRAGRYPIRHLALTRSRFTLGQRLRGWLRDATLLEDPPHLERLDAWLRRV
jgi:CheY-like chemotaxis protein